MQNRVYVIYIHVYVWMDGTSWAHPAKTLVFSSHKQLLRPVTKALKTLYQT